MYIYIVLEMCVYLSINAHAYIYIHTYIYIYIYIYIYTHTHIQMEGGSYVCRQQQIIFSYLCTHICRLKYTYILSKRLRLIHRN